MTSVVDIVSAISEDKSLSLFRAVVNSENANSEILITKLRFNRKEFYSRMKKLMHVGLVKRVNGRYRLTTFGKVVFSAHAKAEIAVENHWKLKAVDSIDSNEILSPEERKKLINNLIDNQEIRDILVPDIDNNNLASAQHLLDIGESKDPIDRTSGNMRRSNILTLTSQIQELRNVFHGLETLYHTYLPKVDPVLLNDLLVREENRSERAPFYMVKVFTKPNTNSEWCKQHIIETTGFVPAIYDKGTHYVTNMRLTLDILKRLDDFDFVEEISGDYSGTLTGMGASHDVRRCLA